LSFISFILFTFLFQNLNTNDNKWENIGVFRKAKIFCVDPFENIIVYDEINQSLLKLSIKGDTLGNIGGYGWSKYSFDHLSDVTSRNGLDFYVADYGNHRVVHLDKNLNYISSFGDYSLSKESFIFRYPRGIALDRFGKLYIIDGENNQIVKINENNQLERSFGGFEAGIGKLTKPTRVRISGDDLVLVQDGNKIVIFDLLGNYIRTIGTGYFKKLISFTVDKNTIYGLDQLRLIKVKTDGKIVSVFSLESFANNQKDSDFISVDVLNNYVYILTSQYVMKVSEASLAK